MLTTLTMLSALTLAPAQAGELRLTNVRPTYGVLGARRPDNKVLPGDFYFITFDIENLKTDDDGKVLYSMGMELLNPKGVAEYKKDPAEQTPIYNVLGGNKIPAFAHAQTGIEIAPGVYTLKVTVIDGATKKTANLEQKFEVVKPTFGLVELSTSYDSRGLFPAPPVGVAGQSLYINFRTVGFARDAKKKPHITFEMQVLDAAGKATLPKPITGDITDLPDEVKLLPMQFLLPLNRPGDYTIKLKATDVAGGKKTAELTFPVKVVELGTK